MKKLFFLTILFAFLYFASPLYAATYSETENIDYVLNTDGTMNVAETKQIKNNAKDIYFQSTNYFTFINQSFKDSTDTSLITSQLEAELATMNVTRNNAAFKNYIVDKKDKYYLINVPFGVNLYPGQSISSSRSYTTKDLAQRVGKLINIYIPSLSLETQKSLSEYVTSYNVTLKIPQSMGKINFSSLGSSAAIEGGYYVYHLTDKDLVNKYLWVQLGSEQLWKFSLTKKVDEISLDNINIAKYDLIIPADDITLNQKIYFSALSPAPSKVTRLDNGNYLFTYYVTKDVKEIVIEGYALQSSNEKSAILSYPTIDLNSDLSAQKYWEVKDASIVAAAASINKGADELSTISNVYNFVVSKVNYDDLKLGINNVRQGAVATLAKGSGVCMEYSDLLITLLRAKGIPSRAIFGKGFDPKSSDQNESHQWVQAYTSTGWISLDPTWGSSGRSFIGSDFDHFSWYISGDNVTVPSSVTVLSPVGFSTAVSAVDLQAVPRNEDVDLTTLDSLSTLTNKYSHTDNASIVTFAIDDFRSSVNIYTLLLQIGAIFSIFVFYKFVMFVKSKIIK